MTSGRFVERYVLALPRDQRAGFLADLRALLHDERQAERRRITTGEAKLADAIALTRYELLVERLGAITLAERSV